MTLPRTVADVLSGHVTFEVECIDRMYLNVYVPQLQYATGLVSYIHRQLGKPVASTAALAPVSEAFTRSVRSFAASGGIPWVDFAKGQRKDEVALQFLAGFTGTEGVLFIGRAQEKVPLFRTRKRRRADGSSYPWIAAETGVVNQHYCYCVDEGFGPFFLKFCSYFPFNAKLCTTATSGPSGRPPGPGSASPRWTTALPPSMTRLPCRRSAPPWARRRSTRCCASGWPGCRTRSAPPTGPPGTGMTSPSCRRSSP